MQVVRSYTGMEKQCCSLGLSHDDQNRDCETRTNIVSKYLSGKYQNCSRAFLKCCLDAKEKGFTEMQLKKVPMLRTGDEEPEPDFVSINQEEFYEKGQTIRSDFRETWIFKDQIIGPDNIENYEASLPHSITTWVISAVSVSPRYGMCVSEPQKIESFKKVFLQLNLPYSVVRNEQIEVQATVFNYNQRTLRAIVYMYGVEGLCSGASVGEKSERGRLVIEADSAGTVSFPVIPLKTGIFHIKVVVVAQDGSDVIMKELNVVPEGYSHEVDIPIKLDPSNQQRRQKKHITNDAYSDSIDTDRNVQTTVINLAVPENFVPGTASCSIMAIGDQFGPTVETALTDPNKLLLLPRGCGEQNMMFLAPTLYTMRYLKVKGKISPEIEEKGYSFIRQGYGSQLGYRKEDGSYSTFHHSASTIWLTAFVIKVFCQANELVHIDEDIMCSGIRFLMNQQQPDGSFIEITPVFHAEMMGGVKGQTPLTAFVLITLEECKCDAENLLISKKRALAFLENHLGDVDKPLSIAIMAYALSLSDSALKQAAHDRLMGIAKFDEGENRMYWGEGDSAQDIEATAYALLNLMIFNDMVKGNAVINWLNTQQLQSGSFKSTQDTVVALQAMSEYAIRAQLPLINLIANITSSNDRNFFQKPIVLNEQNAHVLQEVKVRKIGGVLYVTTAGHGIGSLLVKLRYNLLQSPENICKFDVTVNVTEIKRDTKALFLDIDPRSGDLPSEIMNGIVNALNNSKGAESTLGKRTRRSSSLSAVIPRRLKRDASENNHLALRIKICVRYLGNKLSGMSIVDAGIFSGFVVNEEDLLKLQKDEDHLIERYEKSSKSAVFYLKRIPTNENYCFSFRVTREYNIGKTQSSIVKVYDYYNPDETCTVFYSPGSNSPILRKLCNGGVCQCAEGGCPPKEPFQEINSLEDSKKKAKLIEIACERNSFVWKGRLSEDIKKLNGFYNISFEIVEVIKEGIEKRELIEGEVRNFLARDNCDTAVLHEGETYLIMGKDGQKYKTAEGVVWYRYLLDKTSSIHLWVTDRKKAKDPKLQRYLNQMVHTIKKSQGCLT